MNTTHILRDYMFWICPLPGGSWRGDGADFGADVIKVEPGLAILQRVTQDSTLSEIQKENHELASSSIATSGGWPLSEMPNQEILDARLAGLMNWWSTSRPRYARNSS